jgi:hypothetical protein
MHRNVPEVRDPSPRHIRIPFSQLVTDTAASFADRSELLQYGGATHLIAVPPVLVDSIEPASDPVDRLHDLSKVEIVTRHTQAWLR